MPGGGFRALLEKMGEIGFTVEADVRTKGAEKYRYRVEPEIDLKSGQVSTADEFLAQLGAKGGIKGKACIERVGEKFHIRRKRKPAHPRQEPVGLNHSILSDRSLSDIGGYPWIEAVREELASWRIYYFEPRMAMRNEESPADVVDIGIHGEYLAAFLYKLQAQYPKHFDAVLRTLRSIVPSVESLAVELDEHRGTLALSLQLAGVVHSSRVLSEGTLRVLALCAIAVNPWSGSLIALEEPENGVPPRRLELIAQLLLSLAEQEERQVIVTTHSPRFVDAILDAKRDAETPSDVGLFNVRRGRTGTVIQPFDEIPLFKDSEVREALTSQAEDGMFGSLLLRGFIDELDYHSSQVQLEQPLRHRRRPQRHMDQSRDHVGQVEATIEPILELRQVTLCILGTNRMVGAAQGILDVAENRIHPPEFGVLDAVASPALATTRCLQSLMRALTTPSAP